MVDLLTKDLRLFKRIQSKCRSVKLHLTRDILMQSQPLVWMIFQPAWSLMVVGLGYSVREYPRFDSLMHPQTSFTRSTTDHPGYKRQALMSNAWFHNDCFDSSNTTLGIVSDDVGYLVPESLIPYERYNTEVAGFQRVMIKQWNQEEP